MGNEELLGAQQPFPVSGSGRVAGVGVSAALLLYSSRLSAAPRSSIWHEIEVSPLAAMGCNCC